MTDRAEWRRNGRGCWSLSLGSYGQTIRITQREPGGVFYRVAANSQGKRTWRALDTRSRMEARQLGEALLRAMDTAAPAVGDARPPAPQQAPEAPAGSTLTVAQLWNHYQEECPAYRRNTKRTREDKQFRAPLLVLGLGANTRVDQLTLHNIEGYVELRERGTGWSDGRTTAKPRGRRTVQADLTLLRTMINWAATVRRPDGSWLLAENPLRGLQIPREENPRRPVTNYTRFQQTMAAIDKELAAATSDSERARWRRVRIALQLVEATGCRIGAGRRVRWEDIDWAGRSIRWRAQTDKRGKDRTVPISQEVFEALHALWLAAGCPESGWVMPSPRGNECPTSMLSADLRQAEALAGLAPLNGGLWHAYRRKWVVERKNFPLKDVMEAGGWSDVTSVMRCYQHADDETLLQVVASPIKLVQREDGLSGLRPQSRTA